MSAASRRQRGHEAETAVAAWFRAHAWPHAVPVGAGRNGCDITGMPGYAPEVKAADEFRLMSWLADAAQRPGLPFVIYRGRGQGPATIGRWPMILTLAHGTELLIAHNMIRGRLDP